MFNRETKLAGCIQDLILIIVVLFIGYVFILAAVVIATQGGQP